jgi:hypothetical protein
MTIGVAESTGFNAGEDRVAQAILHFKPANEAQRVLVDKVLLAWFRLRRARAGAFNNGSGMGDLAHHEECAASRAYHHVLKEFTAAGRHSPAEVQAHLPSRSAFNRA